MILLFYLIEYNIYEMCVSGIFKVVAANFIKAQASSLTPPDPPKGKKGCVPRKMDNRGSKSMMLKNIIVKEQRVDGS